MVLLAHIRDLFAQNHNSNGRVRMTEELKEMGLRVGHRRLDRLMRQNGISVIRTRKHKSTIDSNHKFNIAPPYWIVTLQQIAPIKSRLLI